MVCTESEALIRELTCPCMHYKQHARCSDAKYVQNSDMGRPNYDKAVMSPIWTAEVLVLIFDYTVWYASHSLYMASLHVAWCPQVLVCLAIIVCICRPDEAIS